MKSSHCLIFFLAIVLSSCVTKPTSNAKRSSPQELFAMACSVGKTVHMARGEVNIKIDSPELRGNFTGHVIATSPADLKLEINNPFGGTEAVISANGNQYEVHRTRGKNTLPEKGEGAWGGIPISWTVELFLGRIPCPKLSKEDRLYMNEQDYLIVELASRRGQSAEQYSYRFKEIDNKIWPDLVHWERNGITPIKIDLKLFDPEATTQSPTKWEARSIKGSLKIRWKHREIDTHPGISYLQSGT